MMDNPMEECFEALIEERQHLADIYCTNVKHLNNSVEATRKTTSTTLVGILLADLAGIMKNRLVHDFGWLHLENCATGPQSSAETLYLRKRIAVLLEEQVLRSDQFKIATNSVEAMGQENPNEDNTHELVADVGGHGTMDWSH
ncbi:hypothetical protein, partial, partial [Parasitella parasitica]